MSYVAVKPQTRYGNTFGVVSGSNAELEDWDYDGEIDYSKLNRRRFKNEEYFSEFYDSIKDFILARLGFPVVRVELTDFQIQTAIDEAISRLDYHAPDWCTQFCTFAVSGGVSLYELPQVVMNNFRNAVYRKHLLSLSYSNGTLEFDFFIKYFQDNFLFSDFSVADFYLLQQHLEMTRKVLSQEGSWDVINGNVLQLYPTPHVPQEVILMYRGLDTGTMHPYYKNWLQRYTLAVNDLK